MLFGIGSDSAIKDAVKKSFNSASQSHLDFENKLNKQYFIKEIFQSLGWDDLYARTDWWDGFGWDRTSRMERVETIVQKALTEKKIESSGSVPIGKVEDLKNQFPFFDKQELAALATASGATILRQADARKWDSTLKRIEKEKPVECTDSKGWQAVTNLSDVEIDRFKTLIRKGVDPKYLRLLTMSDRQTLIHIGNLYRDLGENRDRLPANVQKLFRACDKSNLILFALERKIGENRSYFERAQNGSVLKELNVAAEGEVEKTEFIATFPILKALLNQHAVESLGRGAYKIVTHTDDGKEVSVWVHSTNALYMKLNRLRVNESFDRAVQAALLQEAFDKVTGKNPGALDWQISELTNEAQSGASLTKSPGKRTAEIHDLGNGKIRVDYISQSKIQDRNKNSVASSTTRFSYSFAPLTPEKHTISKLHIGRTVFEWDAASDTPFLALRAVDLQKGYEAQIG